MQFANVKNAHTRCNADSSPSISIKSDGHQLTLGVACGRGQAGPRGCACGTPPEARRAETIRSSRQGHVDESNPYVLDTFPALISSLTRLIIRLPNP